MQNYLITYDISDNKKRNRLIDLLKTSGFYRVQYSVFAGKTTKEAVTKIKTVSAKLLDKNDRIIILPIPEAVIEKIVVFNQGSKKKKIDIDLIFSKKVVLFI